MIHYARLKRKMTFKTLDDIAAYIGDTLPDEKHKAERNQTLNEWKTHFNYYYVNNKALNLHYWRIEQVFTTARKMIIISPSTSPYFVYTYPLTFAIILTYIRDKRLYIQDYKVLEHEFGLIPPQYEELSRNNFEFYTPFNRMVQNFVHRIVKTTLESLEKRGVITRRERLWLTCTDEKLNRVASKIDEQNIFDTRDELLKAYKLTYEKLMALPVKKRNQFNKTLCMNLKDLYGIQDYETFTQITIIRNRLDNIKNHPPEFERTQIELNKVFRQNFKNCINTSYPEDKFPKENAAMLAAVDQYLILHPVYEENKGLEYAEIQPIKSDSKSKKSKK